MVLSAGFFVPTQKGGETSMDTILLENLERVDFKHQLQVWKNRKDTVDTVTISLTDKDVADPAVATLHVLGLGHVLWAMKIRPRVFPEIFYAVILYYPTREFIHELRGEGFILFADHCEIIAETQPPCLYHSLVDGISIWISPHPLSCI